MSGTQITHWPSIDNLAGWAKVEVLRLSCAEAKELTPEAVLKHDPTKLSGDPRVDRPFLIAKLEHLTMLNGVPVSSTERWDAELYYVHFINALPSANPDHWGRYDELVAKHGKGPKAVSKGPQTLKSKLLSESPASWSGFVPVDPVSNKCGQGLSRAQLTTDLNVIPPSGHSFTLRALPSMSIAMLRKKIAVKLKQSADTIALWTAFAHKDLDGFWERGEQMDTSRDVGWYLNEHDGTVLVSIEE
ncbi:hypothetical protein A1Q1_06969 [Trichosporon asahii var. asahii CBS 2479]|jgi:hypothetical protein|uniref:Uncharacterized protein n=1 Tax=Trichosporon asahii var. asahii (strain ATCC 90039 / CBS 2479 / JCM 2466 / KCTC 7840 / NBRC 103889/ NCYC 2677 / UAMH 7654) TaxID=1186058 RepID=J5RBI0_TRIAS|nr:hypothetical protein A1Q1_06969 [Trichosporon asahii var. asahii CBS 2479]EJT51738.1 hypothetical protein A1Q1_06969 [Trichosporon asahii var. asahii CBS 2479]